MRYLVGAIIALTFCGQAGAQDSGPPETIQVDGVGLDGVWSIPAPLEMSISLTQSARFGPLVKRYCRFEGKKDHTSVHCFGPRLYKFVGTAEAEGNKLHLAWGMALARVVIDATLTNPTRFDGTFGFKFMGIRHDDPEAIAGEKIQLSAAAEGGAGKAALLSKSLQELVKGGLVSPHDEKAIQKYGTDALRPDDLRSLGAVEAMRYVGRAPRAPGGKDPDFFSVYQVEFASGERLCGLHQREDGVLDALICV